MISVKRAKIGFGFSLSMWLIGLSMVFYQLFFLGIDKLFCALIGTCILGVGSSWLYKKNTNKKAVSMQVILLLAAFAQASRLPSIGIFFDFCLVGVAIYPLVFLEKRDTLVVFGTLSACLLLVCVNFFFFHTRIEGQFEFLAASLFLFYLKVAQILFIFFLVFYLRVLLDKIE